MQRLPLDPRYGSDPERPTWRGILAAYVAIAAIPVLLWMASHPIHGLWAMAGVVALLAVRQRVMDLVRCLRECRAVTVDVGGTLRVTVSRLNADDAN